MKFGVIVDVEASRSIRQAEVGAAKTMLERTEERFGLKPFTVDGFSDFMRDAITAAGLPLDCQPHGLRKAAGRQLAEAGCSTKQIMAVLGHKSIAEAERYTRETDQVRLATAAISMLEAQTENEICPNRPFQFGNFAKKIRRDKMMAKGLALPSRSPEPRGWPFQSGNRSTAATEALRRLFPGQS